MKPKWLILQQTGWTERSPKGPGRHENWAHVKLMKFTRTSARCFSWARVILNISTNLAMNLLRINLQRRTREWKKGFELAGCTCSLCEKKFGQWVEGGHSLLLCSFGTSLGILLPVPRPHKKDMNLLAKSAGESQRWSKIWSTSPMNKGWERWSYLV